MLPITFKKRVQFIPIATFLSISISACGTATKREPNLVQRGPQLQTQQQTRPHTQSRQEGEDTSAVPTIGQTKTTITNHESAGIPNTQQAAENQAAIALRTKADAAMQSENYPLANRLLERALRVSAGDYRNYLALARLRVAEGKAAEARSFAQRGLGLKPDQAGKAELRSIVKIKPQS